MSEVFYVDPDLLKGQINDLLESNIPEDSKSGLHHMLGSILDHLEKGKMKILRLTPTYLFREAPGGV